MDPFPLNPMELISKAMADYGTKKYKGVLARPLPDRTERVRRINERISKPLHMKPLVEVMKEIEADASIPEPTVCLFFEGHKSLTPEEFQFHRTACAYKYINQLNRAKLPRDTINCDFCFQSFLPPEAEYHHKRCDKKRAAWIKQAKNNEKLAKLSADKKAKKKSQSGDGHDPTVNSVAMDEDWDTEKVPERLSGGPVCGYNPFLKVDRSAVIVTPMGKTRSVRRNLIKGRVELFAREKNLNDEN